MKRFVIPLVAALTTVACGNPPNLDRSDQAIKVCESEVAKRLGADAAVLTFDSSANRFGSGGWDVKGTVARRGASPEPFTCGVYADGDRNRGPLRVDGVRLPADPSP